MVLKVFLLIPLLPAVGVFADVAEFYLVRTQLYWEKIPIKQILSLHFEVVPTTFRLPRFKIFNNIKFIQRPNLKLRKLNSIMRYVAWFIKQKAVQVISDRYISMKIIRVIRQRTLSTEDPGIWEIIVDVSNRGVFRASGVWTPWWLLIINNYVTLDEFETIWAHPNNKQAPGTH